MDSLERYQFFSIHFLYIYNTCRRVQFHNTAKGKHQGVGFKLVTYTHGCTQRSLTMANHLTLDNLPFANVADNAWLDNNRSHNNSYDINNLPSSNNDILTDIDPDINNLTPNGLKNQCKGYDTSNEMGKDICFQNNITMLHANIFSSTQKIKRLMYYIDKLNINFTFIGLSETWAS